MKHFYANLYLGFIILSLFCATLPAQSQSTAYIDGQLFVKFSNTCSFEWQANNAEQQDRLLQINFPDLHSLFVQYHVEQSSKAFKLKSARLNDIYLLQTTNPADALPLMQSLNKLNYVGYAERVPNYHVSDCPPNDPLFSQQWSLQNTNTVAAISALTNGTCNTTTANCMQETVIAIVDDAVRYTHEDIAPKMWNNAAEINNNGIDDDNNGYIDDMRGWDCADNDNNPAPNSPTNSSFTHGTHCAGIAAAATDNNLGIASPGFSARIMAVKCASVGDGGLPSAYLGVEYAIAAHANVISMSWGGGAFSATFQALFDEAHSAGIVCVAAAGNDNTLIPMYPASYNHVISVASSDNNNQKSFFSNYGTSIDITAPGSNIMSTLAGSDNAYGNLSGTSMACPFVSGVCGMMICFNPNLTPDAILSCIQNSATNIDANNASYIGQLGAGLINVEGVLQCLQVPPVAVIGVESVTYCPGQTVAFSDNSVGYQITSRQWTFAGGTPATSTSPTPTVTFATPGNHAVTLTVTNQYGNHTTTQNVLIGTPNASLSGSTTIVGGTYTTLSVQYNGLLPYNLSYTDGTNNFTLNNIDQNPFYFNVTPAATTTYSLLSATGSNNCMATTNGQANVNVLVISGDSICSYTKVYGTAADNNSGGYYDPTTETYYWASSNPQFGAIDARTGNVLWGKNYPGITAAGFAVNGTVIPAPNGDWVLLGGNGGGSSANWGISRVDAAGNFIWSKNLQCAGRQMGQTLVASTNDTYIIGGWFNTDGSTSDDYGLLKLDGNGNQIAAKRVAIAGDDQAGYITSDNNGGIYLLGEVEGQEYLVVMHYDANLTLLQSARINHVGAAYSLNATSANIAPDGNLLITTLGQNGGGSLLLKIRSDLSSIFWAKRITISGNTGITANHKCVNGTNTFYVIGNNYNSSWGNPKGFIAEFDLNGNVLLSKTINTANSTLNFVAHNATTPNHELLLGWAILNSTYFGAYDFSLMRTNHAMTDACLLIDYPITATNDTWTLQPVAATETAITFTPVTIASATQNYTLFVNTPCINCDVAPSCNIVCGISASATALCANQTVNLSATCSGYSNYVWVINDTLTFHNGTSTSYEFEQAGSYNIKLYVSDGSCSQSYEHTVTVSGINGGADADAIICNGETTALSATGGTSYQWAPAAGLSCISCPNPIASPNTSTEYYVTITNANGCLLRDSVMIWLAPPPVLLPVSTNISTCDTPATVSLNPEAPVSGYSYQWSPASGLSCTNCANPIATLNSSATYTVVITNSFGCTAQQNFTVNVNNTPPPTPSFSVAIPCGTTAPVPLNGTPAGGVFSGTGVSLVGSQYWFNPASLPVGSTGSITYTVTNLAGCTASSTQTVSTPALPNASFSGLAASYCQSADNAILTPVTPGGTFSGQSIFNNASNSTGIFAIRFVTTLGVPIPITYTVTDPLTGCTNSSVQNTIVYPQPNADVANLADSYWNTEPPFGISPVTSGGTLSNNCGLSNYNAISPAAIGAGNSCCITYQISANGCSANTQNCFSVFACVPPTLLSVQAVAGQTATLSWTAVPNATNYVVRYHIQGSSGWSEIIVSGNSYVLEDLLLCTNYEVQVATLCNNSPSSFGNTINFSTSSCGSTLYLKAFLQGAYNAGTGQMNNNLNTIGFAALLQPFNVAPWHYAGNENIATYLPANANATDWVLVELRANPSDVPLASQAALLFKDGTIKGIGGDVLRFDAVPAGNYYVVIRSRNHLAVMSAQPVSFPNTNATTYDFSSAAQQAMGTAQQIALGNGKYGLYAGDFDGNGIIQVFDSNCFIAQNPSTNDYFRADFDLDGNVNMGDYNLMHPNLGKMGIMPIRLNTQPLCD